MFTFSDFLLFLYEEKCLVNYVENIKNDRTFGMQNDVKNRADLISGLTPSSFLLSAFIWGLSPEGLYFWTNINIKWKKLISNER